MKHLKKYNEDVESPKKTLRDLIGEIKEVKKVGYHNITETTKGCFINLELEKYLDCIVQIHRWGSNYEVYIEPQSGNQYGRRLNAYFEGDIPKILSTYPGDERGSCVFGDVFISSGHDGNYLWNIKTGEFKANTW